MDKPRKPFRFLNSILKVEDTGNWWRMLVRSDHRLGNIQTKFKTQSRKKCYETMVVKPRIN